MRDRDERREFEADVFYEAWRRGYDPDRAVACADDCYYNDRTPEQCVDGYAREVRERREAREREEYEQQQAYFDAMEAEQSPPMSE